MLDFGFTIPYNIYDQVSSLQLNFKYHACVFPLWHVAFVVNMIAPAILIDNNRSVGNTLFPTLTFLLDEIQMGPPSLYVGLISKV